VPAAADAGQATPERIVLTPTEHADTAQSFTWRTGADATDGAVSIRKVGDTAWRSVDAYVNDALESAGVPTRTHSVTVDQLAPATEYEYFVGNGTAVSDTFRFRTAGTPGDPFTFLYFGDAQNDLTEKWAPVVEQAFDRFPDAVGTVNAGDLVNTGGNDGEWTEWFGAMDGYSQTRNVIAAPGNHEYGGDEFLKVWKSNFEYDANGPKALAQPGLTDGEKQKAAYEAQMEKALAETAYYTDYQGVRFISLNASRDQAVELMTPDDLPPCLIACPNPTQLWLDMQGRWLDSILANNPNKWAVAVFHQPVFSTAEGRDEVDVRETWLPVFQRNDIDLVLMGHDHTYGRGFVNSDATTTPGMTTGPVYTVAVSGPKYYELQPEDDNVWTQNGATMVTRAGHTSTFQGITVTKDQLRYEAVVAAKWDDESTTDKAVGETLDAFTITKYDSGEKYVTEDGVAIPAPSTPQNPGTEEPPAIELPAEQPADVPLGHEVLRTFTTPSAAEPGAATVNPSTHVVYVADQASGSAGTVQAIDPETGEVLDQFDVGAPVRDLAYDASFNGVLVAIEGGRIASYLTNPSVFGTPYIDPIPVGVPVRSLQYDGFRGLVYLGLDNGTIMWLDAEEFDLKGTFDAGANLRGMRIDDVTGVLYATFDNPGSGIGLRLYESRNGMKLLKEYTLDQNAGPLDIDIEKGLAYVGHTSELPGQGGLSVVDLQSDTVTHLHTAEFGGAVSGVGVDAKRGIAYLAHGNRAPAPMTVVGRQQAPRILESPMAHRADAGATVTFAAAAFGVPAPTVGWESRAAGATAWNPVEGAGTGSLEVVAADGLHGTQYRAVFTNSIGGVGHATRSATATLRIAGLEVDPGDPGTPGDPGDPGTPGGELPGTDEGGSGGNAASPGTAGGKALAATGSAAQSAVIAAVLLLLAGAAAVVVRRRREATKA
jgi:LPXTG-motif cell wall-anchored protein